MTADNRRQCGTCGARARFMGSHVMSAHTGYAAGQPAYVAALAAEREARTQSFADESAGAAEGYGTLVADVYVDIRADVTDRPEWTRRLVAKDFTNAGMGV